MSRRISVSIMLVLPVLFFVCSPGHGADYPRKMVNIIVTAGAGGGEDTELRGFVPFLEKQLGVRVSIEDIAAASGKVACEKFQKIAPDGYNLLYTTFPKTIVLEYTSKVNFRTKDFTPVFAWTVSNQMLIVHADAWKTFNEFVNAAKAKPLAGGVTGRGSTTHTAGVLAMDALGLKVNWVPYEGSGETLASLAGKHIDFVVYLSSTHAGLVDAGMIRPLIMFADERDPLFPNVPIPKDLGFNVPSLPGIRGLVAPPNTPASIVKVIENACAAAIKEPKYLEWAKNRKVVIAPMYAPEFGRSISESYLKVEKIVPLLTH
jgi:tripartite-type tricarboxylate transporter receptor subunit TctC